MAAEIKQVRTQIDSAFGGLQPPELDEVLRALALEEGQSELATVYRELSGRHWSELDRETIRRRWNYFGSLNAEAFQYVSPALLTAGLEQLEADSSDPLLHRILFVLRPSFWRLYHQGQDKRFLYRTHLFSDAQYGAVCSFLGLVLERVADYEHLSAAALRWGWNRLQQHPALARSQAYYEGRYDYRYPPAREGQVGALVRQIGEAFAAAPYPGDENICHPAKGDEEAAEYALEFREARWQRLHPRFLQYHHPALSFFTPQGFRYFLPAFLVADLMADQLQVPASADPVFHLTHGFSSGPPGASGLDLFDLEEVSQALAEQFPELEEAGLLAGDDRFELPEVDWEARARQRFSPFGQEEREAIVAYLRYEADTRNEFSRPQIEEALRRYWLPSLSPGGA